MKTYLQVRMYGQWSWVREADGGFQLTDRQEDAMTFDGDEPAELAAIALLRRALELSGVESRAIRLCLEPGRAKEPS